MFDGIRPPKIEVDGPQFNEATVAFDARAAEIYNRLAALAEQRGRQMSAIFGAAPTRIKLDPYENPVLRVGYQDTRALQRKMETVKDAFGNLEQKQNQTLESIFADWHTLHADFREANPTYLERVKQVPRKRPARRTPPAEQQQQPGISM